MTFAANNIIMDNMKRLILIFTMAMFLANTFVVTAWAKPCVGSANASVTMEMAASTDMPCHNKSQEDTQHHCDGLCICLHVSTSQTPIVNNASIHNISLTQSVVWAFSNEHIISRHPSPPHRPPNTLS